MFKLPLSDDELLKFIDNQNEIYDIDVHDIEFDAKTSLIYISNLNIKCNLVFATTEEKLNYIKEYMLSQRMISIPNLEKMVIKIILLGRGINLDGYCPEISVEECITFLENNKELVDKWLRFFDSLVIFGALCYTPDENKEKIMTGVEVIDDKEYVGINVANLFKNEEVFFYYVFYKPDTQYNFVRQFNDYIFGGQNLYYYFNTEKNPIMTLIPLMLGE